MVNQPEGVVAFRDVAHQHADGEEVVDLLKRLAALPHFLVDRPEVLGPAGDLEPGEAGGTKLLRERNAQPLDRLLALALLGLDLARQRVIVLGLEELQGEVLELGLHAGHAEPMGQRRIDLARLERDAAPLLRIQVLERPHVVQAVGELDDDDPGVLRDREEELAVVLGLLLDRRAERQRRELREPVHQLGHFGTERAPDVVDRDVRILHHVVQQGGGDADRVHLLLGEDGGDRDRVRHVVVPRLTLLAPVRLGAHAVRARQQIEIEPVVLPRDRLRQLGSEQRCRARHNRPASAKLT